MILDLGRSVEVRKALRLNNISYSVTKNDERRERYSTLAIEKSVTVRIYCVHLRGVSVNAC
jgi:hypothetical protein